MIVTYTRLSRIRGGQKQSTGHTTPNFTSSLTGHPSGHFSQLPANSHMLPIRRRNQRQASTTQRPRLLFFFCFLNMFVQNRGLLNTLALRPSAFDGHNRLHEIKQITTINRVHLRRHFFRVRLRALRAYPMGRTVHIRNIMSTTITINTGNGPSLNTAKTSRFTILLQLL